MNARRPGFGPMAVLVFVLAPVLTNALSCFAQAAANPALDAAAKQAVVDEIAKHFNESYVFPEAAERLEQRLRDKLKSGGYDAQAQAREFAAAVARDILDVTKDRHTGFAYDPETTAGIRRMRSRNEAEVKRAREEELAGARRDNFTFRKAERLAGNVGYLEFRNFLPADVAGPTAIAALNLLAYCDALIVDLRQNGGGDPTLIQLISSYFFAPPTHLNDIWTRATDSFEHFWTLPYVPGPRMAGTDLYVLTSARTFSAAEEFCYNLQNLKRATLVGETTGGGAHPTEQKIVRDDFVLRVPFARSINPVSRTNWEGTGVVPDVSVPAAQALDKAYEMALEKALKSSAPEARREAEWVLAGVRGRVNPPKLDETTLRSYVGEFGEREVIFENGALFYRRIGPKMRLTPLSRTLFAVEGIDYFRLEFVVKDGRAVEVVGLYDNGDREPSVRTK